MRGKVRQDSVCGIGHPVKASSGIGCVQNDLDERVDRREWNVRERIFIGVLHQEVQEMWRRVCWRQVPELAGVADG